MLKSYRFTTWLGNGLVYLLLTAFAVIMLFPFIYMLTTSFKTPADTFRYPPKVLPYDQATVDVAGYEGEQPLYLVDFNGKQVEFALVEKNIPVGQYVDPANPGEPIVLRLSDVLPTGDEANQATTTYEGDEEKLWDVSVNGQIVPMVQVGRTTVGEFVDPDDPTLKVEQNVRLSTPVETVKLHPENYTNVLKLRSMDRSLSNTALVTILVMLGQLTTSVVGGYAFARLKFPGRDTIFLMYLGTIMIPFVLLIVPLYQLMVLADWVDTLTALVIPWVFTAYGTFLMRQFFITIPREIEEAALLDGASRLQILWRIFVPASVPALASLGTFTFLYAWNSFFWPLVIINTGNEQNHVLTLSLNVLRGRAADTPNLILAGAAIAILPPFIIFLLGQRFFVESATASGVKG